MFFRMIKNNKGYTLAEILVVIGIIGTMAAIGLPTLVSQMSHTRLKRSARNVATEINAARVNAIVKNTKYSVDFALNAGSTPDTLSIRVFNGAWGTDTTRASRELDAGIDITDPTSNFSVFFYPNGISSDADNATATNSSICLDNTARSGDEMKINISGSTGRVVIQTGC